MLGHNKRIWMQVALILVVTRDCVKLSVCCLSSCVLLAITNYITSNNNLHTDMKSHLLTPLISLVLTSAPFSTRHLTVSTPPEPVAQYRGVLWWEMETSFNSHYLNAGFWDHVTVGVCSLRYHALKLLTQWVGGGQTHCRVYIDLLLVEWFVTSCVHSQSRQFGIYQVSSVQLGLMEVSSEPTYIHFFVVSFWPTIHVL